MALFVDCNKPLVKKLDEAAESGLPLNMETEFCSVSLDIIGRAVFNYNFGSVNQESPVVKAVYRALQEAEHHSRKLQEGRERGALPFFLRGISSLGGRVWGIGRDGTLAQAFSSSTAARASLFFSPA